MKKPQKSTRLTRRRLLQTGAALALPAVIASDAAAAQPARQSIYQ